MLFFMCFAVLFHSLQEGTNTSGAEEISNSKWTSWSLLSSQAHHCQHAQADLPWNLPLFKTSCRTEECTLVTRALQSCKSIKKIPRNNSHVFCEIQWHWINKTLLVLLRAVWSCCCTRERAANDGLQADLWRQLQLMVGLCSRRVQVKGATGCPGMTFGSPSFKQMASGRS